MKNSTILQFRLTIILLTTIFISICAKGQDFKEDYKKIYKAYFEHPDILVEANYNLYASHSSQYPILTEKGIVKKAKKKMYTSFFGCEILETEEYKVSVDHKNKYIFLTKKNKRNEEKDSRKQFFTSPKYIMPLIDSVYPHLKNIVFRGDVNHIKTYSFSVPNQQDITMEFAYNDSTFMLQKIVIYTNKSVSIKNQEGSMKPRAEIMYTHVEMAPEFQENDFSIYKYVTKNGDKFILKPAFKDYKLGFSKLSK